VRGGRIIDVNDAGSDGPFAPESSGGLPLQKFISLCFSGTYTEPQVRSFVRGNVAYLGMHDVRDASTTNS
jgi:butyrate kinase